MLRYAYCGWGWLNLIPPDVVRMTHPATAEHLNHGLSVPPEALFCWSAADMEMYLATRPGSHILHFVTWGQTQRARTSQYH